MTDKYFGIWVEDKDEPGDPEQNGWLMNTDNLVFYWPSKAVAQAQKEIFEETIFKDLEKSYTLEVYPFE